MDRQVEAAGGHGGIDARGLPVPDEFAGLVIPLTWRVHGAPGRLQGPADSLLQFGGGGTRVGHDEETGELKVAFDHQPRHQRRDGPGLAGSGTRLDECQTCAVEGDVERGGHAHSPARGSRSGTQSAKPRSTG